MDKRFALEIESVNIENSGHKTFEVKNIFDVKPGQFFMITDYKNGEKPFSVSRITKERVSFTVKKLGSFTSGLFDMKPGDALYIRGPYGNGFDCELLAGKKLLLVGGGCGTGPLRSLAEYISGKAEINFINGARSKEDLLFEKGLDANLASYSCATDDGSAGIKGTVIDVCKNTVDLKSHDYIVTSGPEMMLCAVRDYLKDTGIPAFYLIERYMKCAVGICGQCSVDPLGVRVCVEGPVFDGDLLSRLTEFGVYKRDASGTCREF
ncbi:MAG: dihydroorotate dehydrogenase electron transfer subunit [Spirochaetes bacterium]|nr:dihydroorotate dehydrogenase electron transfer subunit [Spirochaetota bacterium]MBN2769842.1 dihydroorotate dehydrogenase electron transfer subunit [Spirochaetota bacterium]